MCFSYQGPKSFKIWETDTCSDSGYHRCNRNSAMLLLEIICMKTTQTPATAKNDKRLSVCGSHFSENFEGWFTLGLKKAEQSLKSGLFYYDEISTPCSARSWASPAQPKNFYALEGTAQPSSAWISAWAGTVLRYSVGIIQEGVVFMCLNKISGRKSSGNGLYRYWNDRTCVVRMDLHLEYCSFKNSSRVQ